MRFRQIVAVVVVVPTLFVATVTAAVFAYGYWHTVTHGVFRVDLRDSSGRQVGNSDSDLTFLDDRGRVLARSATDSGGGVFSLSGEFSCREIEKRAPFEVGGHEAYSRCFERQSRWVIKWVPDVRYVDVRIGGCRWKKVPVIISRQSSGPSDWWLLWPTRHIGGEPFTQFYATVTVDIEPSAACLTTGQRAARRSHPATHLLFASCDARGTQREPSKSWLDTLT